MTVLYTYLIKFLWAVKPVKELPRGSLFLRSDIEVKKKELEQLRKKYRPYDE
jgi:hypothetical protein